MQKVLGLEIKTLMVELHLGVILKMVFMYLTFVLNEVKS